MKPIWKEICTAAFMGLILPGILLHTAVRRNTDEPDAPVLPEKNQETIAPVAAEKLTMCLQLPDGTVTEMDMDEYLTGVVLAEMPASFETEALKAQSVVARTYTLRASQAGVKHMDADVCTDHTCCQAYIAPETYSGGEENLEKVRSAVLATSGQVLTYNGELIEATYFSCSGGSTEDAVAVWGTDYPYLRATESPGEENAAHYTDTVTFSAEEFSQKLGQSLSGDPASWFGFTTYTAGGGVNSIRIGGRDYKGTEVRTLLGLRSTAFSIRAAGDSVTITTKGYGHRVGLSQYGADAMALDGKTYTQILAHYYQGTVLTNFDN